MEIATAIACCAVAFLAGFHVGRRWAPGDASAVLIGLVIGALCAGIYLVLTAGAGSRWPGLLDARVVGLHLVFVLMASSVAGALGALLGYRRSMGRRLF